MEKEKKVIKKVKRSVKGITLIALVVTIIVLLILASVAISLTIGSNGIFTRAGNATEKYEEASINEQKEMNQVTDVLDNYIRKVEGVTIPKGFYYVGGTKEEGIVISDSKEDENKYSKEKYTDQANIPGDGLIGNQFVWVPVENIDEFIRYTSYYKDSPNSAYFTECSEPSPEGYRYPNELEEYNNMKQSVEDNKGFYVARYEAGKENIDGVDIVVSKKGAEVWNNITWGESMTSIGTEGAVAKSQGMYTDKSRYNVTSTLIYGVQWDAIMTWIDPSYKTSNCDEKSFVRNSTDKGNYSGKLARCGSNDNYRVNNIYDLAGNVFEWTMKEKSTGYRVDRGGDYHNSGSGNPTSSRWNNYPDNPDVYIRFSCSFVFIDLLKINY